MKKTTSGYGLASSVDSSDLVDSLLKNKYTKENNYAFLVIIISIIVITFGKDGQQGVFLIALFGVLSSIALSFILSSLPLLFRCYNKQNKIK